MTISRSTFVLPLRMLEAGAALDPLNLRRLLTYGGYAFLQAQVGVVGSEANAYVVDPGLASVLIVMLLAGLRQRRGAGRWVVVVLGRWRAGRFRCRGRTPWRR